CSSENAPRWMAAASFARRPRNQCICWARGDVESAVPSNVLEAEGQVQRRTPMGLQMLQGKRAVVFGAAGSIGAAVAKEFGAQGAEVFLAGRTRSTIEEVAHQITDSGGLAHAAVVDALDDKAVNEYIDGIVKQAGKLDVVFTAVGPS